VNTDPRYPPVVALDLDGVLRVAEPADHGVAPGELFRVELTIRRHGYPTYMHRQPPWDAANTYFAEPLGLPELPVAAQEDGTWSPDSATWKTARLARQFDGRSLLWVDDYPRTSLSMALPMLRRGNDRVPTAVRWIRTWEVGITPADIAEVDAWLHLASAPGGHDELRRRRRRNLARKRAHCRREEWGTLVRYEQWRTIQRRLQAALGPHQALSRILADHALDHVDPTEVAGLVREGGDEDTPAVPDLIRIVRGNHQEDT